MARDLVEAEAEHVSGDVMLSDMALASALARAEIDTQIATARRYPRSVKSAIDNILSLATLDEETATECIYALKRGGKPIRGPSIRLAEVVASQWGNCRDGAAVVAIDRINKVITAEGFFHDLETNRGTKSSVQRRISDSKGRLFSDDMIAVTGNAACSIARRNAILAGVPKGVWRRAVEAAEQIIRGDAKTLVERRDGALKAFVHFNLSQEQVFKILGVAGVEDIGLDDLATMRVIYTAIKNGDQTVEDLLRGQEPEKPTRVTALSASKAVQTPFEDDVPIAPAAAAPAPAHAPAPADAEPADDVDAMVDAFEHAMGAAQTIADVERIWSSVAALGADAVGDRLIALGKIRDAAKARVQATAGKVAA